MQKANFSFEIESVSLEIETVTSLLNTFERWFDNGFKTNDAERVCSEDKSADLWAESPDYAAVFDVAMEKLFKLNEDLKKMEKENAA